MAKLFNRAKMTTSTTGSGTVTLSAAAGGFQSFADAGVSDGDVVQYLIEEGSAWEIGTGTYSSTGTSLTRTPSESSDGGTAITLGGTANVAITAVADDLNRLQHEGSTKVSVSATGASVTGALTTSGDLTVNGEVAADLSFGDNVKAKFGASDDLQIYHDGSNSYVRDNGTGTLTLQGSNQVKIQSPVTGENYAIFNDNGAVTLNYDNSLKFATNANGVDVTGTVTADGAKVEAGTTSAVTISESTGSGTAELRFVATDSFPKTKIVTDVSAASLSLETLGNDRLKIANNGDISFYEDTGTTAKFFWDASAERLGLGTTSPLVPLQVNMTDANFGVANLSTGVVQLGSTSTADDIAFGTIGAGPTFTEYMRIDNGTGNVGIGTTSPAAKLEISHVADNRGGIKVTTSNNTGSSEQGGFLALGGNNTGVFVGTNGASYTTGGIGTANEATIYSVGNVGLAFGTNTTERMRIDSSGNVGIGTTTSAGKLTVDGTVVSQNAAQGVGNVQLQGYGATSYINHSGTGSLIFRMGTGYTERMRIDSSGNLLVGTTTVPATSNTNGFRVDESGYISLTGAGTAAIDANRSSSDGIIANFRKDGSTVGSIGTRGGNVRIGNGDAGLEFHAGDNAIYPANIAANSLPDGTLSLGLGSYRFKDLYLSGGVYLGGTGAANKLTDYEEGTFTPVWEGSTSNPSATYNIQQGFYTKIGKVVHVFLRMDNATYSGGSGELRVGGLPFLVSNQADYYPAMPVAYKFSFVTTGPDWARFNRNLSSVTLYADNNTSETQLNTGNVQASTNVIFSGSYETDS